MAIMRFEDTDDSFHDTTKALLELLQVDVPTLEASNPLPTRLPFGCTFALSVCI